MVRVSETSKRRYSGRYRNVNFLRALGPILLGLVVIAVPLSAQEPAIPIGVAAGEMYPDFLLPDLDGGFIRLSDYRGKKVFLFHFASW